MLDDLFNTVWISRWLWSSCSLCQYRYLFVCPSGYYYLVGLLVKVRITTFNPVHYIMLSQDQVETMDCQLRKNTTRLPFLMLTDLSLVDQRRNLCQALFRAQLAEWSNPTDGIESGMSYTLYRYCQMQSLSIGSYPPPLWNFMQQKSSCWLDIDNNVHLRTTINHCMCLSSTHE